MWPFISNILATTTQFFSSSYNNVMLYIILKLMTGQVQICYYIFEWYAFYSNYILIDREIVYETHMKLTWSYKGRSIFWHYVVVATFIYTKNCKFTDWRTLVLYPDMQSLSKLECVHRTKRLLQIIFWTRNWPSTSQCDIDLKFRGIKIPRCSSSHANQYS